MNGRVRRPVPPSGFQYVLLVGRRRRRRARTTGVALLAVVAVTLGGVVAGADRDTTIGLDVADHDSHESPGPANPTPAPALGSRRPTGRPSPRATASPTPADVSWVSVTELSRDRGRGPRAAGEPVMSGPGKTDDFSHCPDILLGVYCSAVTGPEEMTPGTPAQFTLWVCRHRAAIPETVHFATRQEAEFVVLDARMAEVWRWSRGFAFPPDPHTLTVDGGYCYTWTIDWTGVDARGRALPPGEYKVDGYPWADEWRNPQEDPRMASADVTVTR